VLLGGDGVAIVSRQHGEQGVLDSAHVGVHANTVPDRADPALTPH
jgi:hypothetical protein